MRSTCCWEIINVPKQTGVGLGCFEIDMSRVVKNWQPKDQYLECIIPPNNNYIIYIISISHKHNIHRTGHNLKLLITYKSISCLACQSGNT
jgi:hypothetical protein